MEQPVRVIDIDAVLEKLSIGRSNLYAMINAKTFPAPVKIGRSSRWVESEIDTWIRSKMDGRPV